VSLNDIRLNAGVPTNIKPTLSPGGVTDTIVVESAGEVLKTTQTSADDYPDPAATLQPAATRTRCRSTW
jgi:hypothetical protein